MTIEQYKKMAFSYLNSAFGQLILAVAVVGNGASPWNFSGEQWAQVSNILWTALIPVAVRYFNKKDPAYGRIAEDVLSKAKEESAKALKKSAKKKA